MTHVTLIGMGIPWDEDELKTKMMTRDGDRDEDKDKTETAAIRMLVVWINMLLFLVLSARLHSNL